MKVLNFCTLFDINYLSRGLALYESLERSGGSVREANRITKCVDCGREFTRLSMKKVRCDECKEKRKLNWQREYYQRNK